MSVGERKRKAYRQKDGDYNYLNVIDKHKTKKNFPFLIHIKIYTSRCKQGHGQRKIERRDRKTKRDRVRMEWEY